MQHTYIISTKNLNKIFHIGIPKSGTTTIQSFLENDERINLTRSTFFSTSSWWINKEEKLKEDKVNIESNETLITSGFNKVKFSQVLNRIAKIHPNAKVIVTIRRQEDAILSMYKYHIKHNFRGVKSLKNWMYNTNLGMDYLSLCMYADIANLLILNFKKENIHFLFFEDLKTKPQQFFEDLYKVLDISLISQSKSESKNVMKLSEDQLYSLTRYNKLSLTKVNSENSLKFKKLRSLEKKIKQKFVKIFSFKSPKVFFSIEEVAGFSELSKEFKENNQQLVNLGFVSEEKLKLYKYKV
jgi:hypothetical protein